MHAPFAGIAPRVKQKRKSNKEARKPKKEQPKTNAAQPSLKPGSVKGLENMRND